MSPINSVRFTCTALSNANKAGILKTDADGYADMVLGALNVFNSAGEFYTAEGAKELFLSSGLLQKRIAKGRLRAEYGHPKQLPGESEQAFINRIFHIEEKNVCAHFKQIYLDDSRVVNDAGQKVIAIVGKVKPTGPYGESLRTSMESKDENVCFSIRAFTDDRRVRGVNNRTLKTIITWDYVNCPGIATAEKWKSPSLEGLCLNDEFERTFSRGEMERAVTQQQMTGLSQEAGAMNIGELFTSMGWNPQAAKQQSAFLNW